MKSRMITEKSTLYYMYSDFRNFVSAMNSTARYLGKWVRYGATLQIWLIPATIARPLEPCKDAIPIYL